MSDGDWNLEGLSAEEQELARLLAARAAEMRDIERTAEEIDPQYARTLRAHLLHGEELAPHPAFARRLRGRLTRRSGSRPLRRPRRRFLPWIGAVVLSAVILVVSILAIPHRSGFTAPYPTRADLLFNLPSPARIIRRLIPTMSLVHPATAVPYAGRITVRAPRLPSGPTTVRSYRLSAPSGVAARGRRLLSIRHPVQRRQVGATLWLIAADGGSGHRPLHSLAVSTDTGELIYHDRRNFVLPRSRQAPSRAAAVRAARQWLSRLGWPGGSMPVRLVDAVPGVPHVREVVFGWSGVERASIEQASLWVAPDRSIIEAWLWPPVAESATVTARSVLSAWSDVRAGKVPVSIAGAAAARKVHATATLRAVRATLVLVPGNDGTAYLVPAYRFEGQARLGAASGAEPWVSLSPGVRP